MTDVVRLLVGALGDAVSLDPAEVQGARRDKSGHESATAPQALVTPRTIDEVREVMRIATLTRTPVVPRGAGTGLTGGAIAGAGEIVLSMLAMNRLIEVSTDDELAVVEPGIINADLNRQLEPYGLWYTPDPASRSTSTIGGNIATNAGGLLCAKYGVTRDSVLGLTVVLADGRMLEVGHRTVKGVTGLDLTALMIGSEGTLGVVVGATLKLRRLVAGVRPTISARFDTVVDAAGASAAITATGLRPAALELIGESALEALIEHLGPDHAGLGHPSGSQLIAQTDGPAAQAEADAIAAVMRAHGGTVQLSTDAAEAERLFDVRRSFHGAMAARGTVLIEDVCVPRSALAEMFAVIAQIEQRYSITIPTVAHAADGNLHPNFVYSGDTVPDRIWSAADELFLAALRLGGTLTGEHGIGLLKQRWLRDELGDDQYELQRQIKAVFDPLGILNPGKVFSRLDPGLPQ